MTMETNKREAAITQLTNIGISELIDDSTMPRERFDPSVAAKRPREDWASLPPLPVDHFDDKLLLGLSELAERRRNDYIAVKRELKGAVNYRLHTKGQPFRKIGQLLYCDVDRVLAQRSAEIHQKRLCGDLPPRVKKNPGKMERALAKMNLGIGGDEQGGDVSVTEEKPVIGQHNGTVGEKRKRRGSDSNSNSDSSPARPSKLMHIECSSAGTDRDLDGAGNGHGLSEKKPSTTINPGNGLQEYKDTSTAIDGEFKISKEALATTIETDIAKVDSFRHRLDNLAVILHELSINKLRAAQYGISVTIESESVLAANVQLALTGLRETLDVGTSELPGGNVKTNDGWFTAQRRFEEANIAWQRCVLVAKAREHYEYLHQTVGLVLSVNVMSLFTHVFPEPTGQVAHL